jgi:hypothetical protein
MQKSSETRSKSRNGRSGQSSSSTPKLDFHDFIESPLRMPSSSPTSEKLFPIEKEGSPNGGFLISAPKSSSIMMKRPNMKPGKEIPPMPTAEFDPDPEPEMKKDSPKKKIEIKTALESYSSAPIPAETSITDKATPKTSGKIGYPLKAVISLGINPKKKNKPSISDEAEKKVRRLTCLNFQPEKSKLDISSPTISVNTESLLLTKQPSDVEPPHENDKLSKMSQTVQVIQFKFSEPKPKQNEKPKTPSITKIPGSTKNSQITGIDILTKPAINKTNVRFHIQTSNFRITSLQ